MVAFVVFDVEFFYSCKCFFREVSIFLEECWSDLVFEIVGGEVVGGVEVDACVSLWCFEYSVRGIFLRVRRVAGSIGL